MSRNSSPSAHEVRVSKAPHNWRMLIGLPVWVLVGFFGGSFVVGLVAWVLVKSGVNLAVINPTVLNTMSSILIYAVALTLVIGLPWWLRRYRTTRADVGLGRLPRWLDIGAAPVALFIYLVVSGLVIWFLGQLIPGFKVDQPQQIGFDQISQRYEYILAFVTLVIVAPLAEEVLFRGYFYGKLRGYASAIVSMVVVSAVFGALHGQWNVGIDVFILSLVMCGLREITGSIWAGVLLHMLKNGIAYYFLFVDPSLLRMIGG